MNKAKPIIVSLILFFIFDSEYVMIKNQLTVFMMFWLSLDFIHSEREYSFDILLPFISRCRVKREGEIEIDGQSESARIKRTQIISASKRNNPVRIVVVETTKSNFLHKYEIVTVGLY